MTDHGRVTKEPMVKLASKASAVEIGQAVLDGLAAFEDIKGLPQPNHLERFLRFVGAKSWRAFTRGTLHINVGYDGKEINLIPSRADRRGAFPYNKAPSICPPEPEIVGGRILELAESNWGG